MKVFGLQRQLYHIGRLVADEPEAVASHRLGLVRSFEFLQRKGVSGKDAARGLGTSRALQDHISQAQAGGALETTKEAA